MKEVEELLKSVVTIDDGLKIIANLEKKQALSKKSKQKTTDDSLEGILGEFKTVFYKMQVVSLTLAINPTLDFLIKLQDWFSDNLGQKVILDLSVDTQIIGGAKIICREHFRDFSLAESIEKVAKNEAETPEKESDFMPAVII